MSDSVTCPSCDKKSVENFCGQCGLNLQGALWAPVLRFFCNNNGKRASFEEYSGVAVVIWEACEKYHGIVEQKEVACNAVIP